MKNDLERLCLIGALCCRLSLAFLVASDFGLEQQRLPIQSQSLSCKTLQLAVDDKDTAWLHATSFVIPLFPLRKTVCLPTEPLRLNLYEERYLVMAESILAQPDNHQLFGAIYASSKPQMIKNGNGPIVPMIERGDTGVLCCVIDSEESMIPTVGGELRHRVRLNAIGAARFRVRTILQDGFGGGSTGTSMPYVLAEVELVYDEHVLPNKADQFLLGIQSVDKDVHTSLLRLLTGAFGPSLTVDEDAVLIDLASFALASVRLAGANSKARLDVLGSLSTCARLNDLLRV
jgi:Lon protease-like protein